MSLGAPFQKVCVVGAGAIGGWLAVLLARAGCSVSVLARGATLQAILREGLTLKMAGQTLREQVPASEEPERIGEQQLVILALKAPALPAVVHRLAPLLGPETVVLTAMNGIPWWFLQGIGGPLAGRPLQSVDPNGELASTMPIAQVLGGVVHASCAIESPGVVRHHFGDGLIVGEPLGGESDRVHQLVSLFKEAGLNASASALIQRDIWYKLWGNMTINPVSALTGATGDRILDDTLVRDFISAVMLEAREIGARLGIPIAQQPEDRHAVTRKLGAFKTSMLQDLEAGKPMELDALVGAVRELGQLTEVPTPMTDALFGLARLQARVRGLYQEG